MLLKMCCGQFMGEFCVGSPSFLPQQLLPHTDGMGRWSALEFSQVSRFRRQGKLQVAEKLTQNLFGEPRQLESATVVEKSIG
jgi:hypothetical protein